MSAILEHSANASAIIEYRGKLKYGKIPHWIRESQLESYYNSMGAFYAECLDELVLPERFDKKELHKVLLSILRNLMREDKDFTNLVIKLIENYPRFPMEPKMASEYILALRTLSNRVASAGLKLNGEIALDSLKSNIPYVVFSNLYLGNYSISYFHEYKSKVTEQHFRRNYLLARGRANLKTKKIAIDNYFEMLRSAEEIFKRLLKAQFKLWLFITLSNSEDIKEFLEKPQYLKFDKIDHGHLASLTTEQANVVDEIRYQLYQAEPTLFNPVQVHKPTEAMWKDMVLVRITE